LISAVLNESKPMDKVINVSLGEIKTEKNPCILSTSSMGSCVALMLIDKFGGIGSMAHIMLPDINLAKAKRNKAKFANTVVEIMLKEMINLGATKRWIKAKIAGGANMFPNINQGIGFHIGARNIAAVKDELEKRKIRLIAEDTGGNYGRSVEFFVETGVVRIKSALHGIKKI